MLPVLKGSSPWCGAGLLAERQPTLMFNGYAEEVAGLYSGLDLRRNF